MRFSAALAVCAGILLADTVAVPPEVQRAREELQRIEKLVADGSLARIKLDDAKAAVAEAEDQAFIRQSLYGPHALEDLTEALSKQMVETSQRLLDRQQERVNRQKKLVELGVASPITVVPLVEEVDVRRRTLDLAESRIRLWNQLLNMARAEHNRQLEASQLAALRMSEQDPNYGILSVARLKRLETEFERTFSRPLPVSAKGDTAFHRSLGFDHRGRVDVALSPDSSEGRWLLAWLDGADIPHLAFRSAVAGQSSAPHVHIGPPSLKLRQAD